MEVIMSVVLKKWGNSVAVRIPATIMETAKLKVEQKVELRVEQGKIIIEPTARNYAIKELVAKITSKNKHNEVDFGVPVGRETD